MNLKEQTSKIRYMMNLLTEEKGEKYISIFQDLVDSFVEKVKEDFDDFDMSEMDVSLFVSTLEKVEVKKVELGEEVVIYVDLYVSLDSGYDYYGFLYEINDFIKSVVPNSKIVLEDLIFTKNPMDFLSEEKISKNKKQLLKKNIYSYLDDVFQNNQWFQTGGNNNIEVEYWFLDLNKETWIFKYYPFDGLLYIHQYFIQDVWNRFLPEKDSSTYDSYFNEVKFYIVKYIEEFTNLKVNQLKLDRFDRTSKVISTIDYGKKIDITNISI